MEQQKLSPIEEILPTKFNNPIQVTAIGGSIDEILPTKISTDKLKNKIISDLLQPNYYERVENFIKWSNRWMSIGNFCEAGGKFMLVSGGIIAFASGFFNTPYLSFVSGSVSAISTALFVFGTYSLKQSTECNKQLGIILKNLEISEVPDTVIIE